MTESIHQTCDKITSWDEDVFEQLISISLSPTQEKIITCPLKHFSEEKTVLAIHWHPENVGLELVHQRLKNMYPQMQECLIIPTQHNKMMVFGNYAGAEIDCKASAFKRKVQILIHFEKSRITDAARMLEILDHTRKYRARQLHDFLQSFTAHNMRNRIEEAAIKTGIETSIIRFAQVASQKIQTLLKIHAANIPEISVKNKLLINYLHAHKQRYDSHDIDRVVIFTLAVKEIVKSRFSLEYFYEIQDIIAEVRALGGCVVVPHPEQFWPILLADYDVDGYEVWNPQSREYTEFLIQTVFRKNQSVAFSNRPLIIFMGDDTHLSEKLLNREAQNPDKASREVGYQPAWRDPLIRNTLESMGIDKTRIIRDYKNRLKG